MKTCISRFQGICENPHNSTFYDADIYTQVLPPKYTQKMVPMSWAYIPQKISLDQMTHHFSLLSTSSLIQEELSYAYDHANFQ